MMKFLGRLAFLLLFAGLLASCDADVEAPPAPHASYASPTAPESLITNLQLSYRQREIKEYAKLLAPEFLFKFQPIDANVIGTEFWTRDQDSTGTRALLTATLVSEIKISLLYGARDTTINFHGTPLDSLKIRVINTDLQVDQTDGITWVITDQQDFFFRQGKTQNGEDPTHWFIYEWDDLPTAAAPGLRAGGGTTWGNLKNLYDRASK
jgi:hypothetical protein